MNDPECVVFLQWALPRLQMRWPGFRKVRGQVRKRLQNRLRALGLADPGGYRAHLETHPDEWQVLDTLCRITISRFYRDGVVFDRLGGTVLPRLAEEFGRILRCWSAGCCSGEEAYTLQILGRLWSEPPIELVVEATDTDAALLDRARRGIYPASAVRDLPRDLTDRAFEATPEGYLLRPPFSEVVRFHRQELRTPMPEGIFDVILCRNLVFTYYDELLQATLLARLVDRLAPWGVLVVGQRESPPIRDLPLERESVAIYRRLRQP